MAVNGIQLNDGLITTLNFSVDTKFTDDKYKLTL